MRTASLLLVFVLALLVGLVALAPARLITTLLPPSAQLSFGQSSGTIWQGAIQNVQWGGVPLGLIRFEQRSSALLSAKVAVSLAASDGALQGQAQVLRGLGGQTELSTDELDLNLDALPLMIALRGRVSLEDANVAFNSAGRCTFAQGSLTLVAAPTALPVPDSLRQRIVARKTGAVSCQDGALQAHVSDDWSKLTATVDAGGWWQVRLALDPETAAIEGAMRRVLMMAGFQAQGASLVFTEDGTW